MRIRAREWLYAVCSGGPRFWRVRSKETRCCASAWGATEGCCVSPANTEAEVEGANDAGMSIAGCAAE